VIRLLRILPAPVLVAAIVPPVALATVLAVTSAKLTVSVAASTVPISSCTLNSTADGWASDDILNSTDGTAATLSVRSDALGDRLSFVKFDVASCVPSGADVKTAELRLFMSTAPNVSRTYQVHRVTGTWSEADLAFNEAFAPGTNEISTGTTNNVTLSWNVQGDVQLYADGTANEGWRVKDKFEDNLTAITGTFHSRQGANDPQLVITYYP
jgi:hypothetical protein